MRSVLHFVLFLFVLCSCSLAQQAGSRDLTLAWRAPNDHIPSPESSACPNVNSTVSGAASPAQVSPGPVRAGKDLQLTIAGIVPPQLSAGAHFTATVRLKNIGKSKAMIPWQPDGELASRISQDGKEERYEVADVTFRLKTGSSKVPMFLQSEGALFANPGDRATYLELPPGKWVDIKLKGTAECGLEECPGHIQPDEHGVLTAWWYQRVLTHKVDGCSEDHGSQSVRELDSSPFSVIVRPPAAAEKKPE